MSNQSLWLEMNAAIDALAPEQFKSATACPRCGAVDLAPAMMYGKRFLNDDIGAPHKCPDVIDQLAAWNAEQVVLGKALEAEGYSEGPTWRGGATGDIELTRSLTLPRRGFIVPHDAKL